MPKAKKRDDELARERIEHYPELRFDGVYVHCDTCKTIVDFRRKCNFDYHVNSIKHVSNIKGGVSADEFKLDLMNFMISSDIPWYQLSRPHFRQFLEKYTKFKLPDESHLRKCYLKEECDKRLEKIREDLRNKYICLSIDETKDATDRQIINTLLWGLDKGEAVKPHLVSCKFVEKVDHVTIVASVKDTLKWLWQELEHCNINMFILLVTDDEGYMLKAGKVLQEVYPDLVHFTCAAHGLHQVAKQIKDLFPDVNDLISEVRKIFLKAPSRTAQFYAHCPEIPLPPNPIVTRWGPWLQAAFYYAKHFENIKSLINTFDSHESIAICKAQKIFDKPTLKTELEYINTNFNVVVNVIEYLQCPELSIHQSLQKIGSVFDKLEEADGRKGLKIYHKLYQTFSKNPGFEEVTKISKLLEGNTEQSKYLAMRYAPLTCAAVERSFSTLNWIFNSQRQKMTIDNLERIMILNHANKYM